MKVFRVIARLNVGGPARHVVWLSSDLAREGIETMLVAGRVPEGEGDMAYFAESHGVAPVFIDEMSRELSLKDGVSIWKVLAAMRRFQPDIVHTHTAKAGTVGRLSALAYRWLTPLSLIGRPRRVKVVHTFHGHVFHSYYGKARTRLFILIEQFLARFATDAIVVISRQQMDEINRRFRVGRSDQFRIVPLGIDLDRFAGAANGSGFRDEIGVGEKEFLATFVGRLTEIKNVPMIIDAAAAIASNSAGSPAIRFAIVGDGHLRSELEARSKESGGVVFAGNRDEVAAVYAASDVVVLTSVNEGTPLSLIEAMAAGRPVISTAVGGVVDLLGEVNEVADGYEVRERGITVASGDVEGLVRALLRIEQDAVLREKLALIGSEFVRENYSKSRLSDDINKLYIELLN